MKKLRKTKALASLATLTLVSALVVPLFSQLAVAQATTGGLRGVVTDPQNAVIYGAEVIARHTATNVETKTQSNSEGIYSFVRLAPGIYTLTIQKEGFKTQEFQAVTVNVGQDSVIDSTLQVGARTETITVTAQGQELIQKEQAQISNTFQSRKVVDLPSNAAGGGIDTLALLAPGVVPGFGNVNSNGTTLSVNGNRARSNNFTIDGADNNDLSIGGPNYFVDNQDIVAEFQVITNNFSAEYGRNQGAIVNVVTKSGTNQFHGTAGWIHRDQKLFDALTNIERRGGSLEDPLPRLQNVYTGTIGGPILKDRLFFFTSYQRITVRESFLSQAGNPTIAASDLAKIETIPGYASNPVLQTLRNFSAFAITDFGTVRERTDLSQTNTIVLGGVTLRTAFPERIVPLPVNQPEFSARGDFTINDKHSVWYRHLYQSEAGENFLFNAAGFTGNIPFSSKIGTGQWTSQISGTSVNEFRFNYNKLSVIFGGGCEGLKSCIPHPDQIGEGLTNITFNGLTSGGTTLQGIGAATNLPQGRVVTVYQFADNFSKTMGKHQLKMGADIRRLTNAVPFLPNVNGAFRFPSATAVTQNRPSFVNLAAGQVEISYNETDQFYYFNDDFRIKDNLTLNLGLRYEYIGQPINTLNKLSVFRESDPAQALWKQSLPLEARTLAKLDADKNNWAPRLGFAWRPGGGDSGIGKWLLGEQDQTVIRGGYTISYDPPFYNLMLNISTSSPLVFLNTTLNPAAPAAVTFPLPSNPIGANVLQFATSNQIIARNIFDPRFFSQTIVSNNFYLPYAQQYQFGIQRELTRDNVVEARWVATKGTGLFQTLNRNPRVDRLLSGFTANVPGLGNVNFPGFPGLLPPGTTAQVAGVGACVDDPATVTLNEAAACNGRVLPQALVRARENTASSIYHSLQTRYQGRVANQVDFTASYTWSKALDNASEVFTFQEASGSQHPFNTNAAERSYSGFDRRHAFSMSWIWDIPVYKDQKGVLGRIAGGWQLNGVFVLANGLRFTPSQFLNFAVLGANRSYDDTGWAGSFLGQDLLRPFYGNRNAPRNSVGISQVDAAMMFGIPAVDANGFWSFNELNSTGDTRAVSRDEVRYIFNGPGAARIFQNPFGDVCRGCETGPRLNNLNLGVFKNIRLREAWKLRFSLDIFNALNHKNPGYGFNAGTAIPDRFVDDAGAEDGFNERTGMEGARRVLQFGLKFIF